MKQSSCNEPNTNSAAKLIKLVIQKSKYLKKKNLKKQKQKLKDVNIGHAEPKATLKAASKEEAKERHCSACHLDFQTNLRFGKHMLKHRVKCGIFDHQDSGKNLR